MKAIILAGGSGTRLWPMSRSNRPKQFFNIIGEDSLIKDTYRRLLRLFPAEKIYFSTSPQFASMILDVFPGMDESQIIVEPEKRDTGPAMGYVAAIMELSDPDEPMVFVPSDHYIKDEELFLRNLSLAGDLVEKDEVLVDISIPPTFPSTILGYTHIGDTIQAEDGIDVLSFLGHTEKPDYEVAKRYIEEGDYLWHANYYTWTPRQFMNAFEMYAPEIGVSLRRIQELVKSGQVKEIASIFSQIQKISFDYAVTEKMDPSNVRILKGEFGWSDVGAWDTLYDRLADGEENITKGNCVTVDTSGSLIYANEKKVIAVLGLKDVVIVDTDDALLVCSKEKAQELKKIVAHLDENNQHHVL